MAASVTNRNGGKEKNKMRVRGPTACPPPTNRFVPKARTKYIKDGKDVRRVNATSGKTGVKRQNE